MLYQDEKGKGKIGEVRLHQGNKLLVLRKDGKWDRIRVEDVKKVYDGYV